jgi:hypothetical protein
LMPELLFKGQFDFSPALASMTPWILLFLDSRHRRWFSTAEDSAVMANWLMSRTVNFLSVHFFTSLKDVAVCFGTMRMN